MTDEVFDRDKLRREAIELLGFDADHLSPLEALQCDVAGSLLLVVDGIQTAQLNGKAVDMSELAEAVKLLRSLLPSATVTPPQPDFRGAREALAGLLEARARARDAVAARAENEEIARLEAALADRDAKIAELTAPARAPALPKANRSAAQIPAP
jgi:hypothetical protein